MENKKTIVIVAIAILLIAGSAIFFQQGKGSPSQGDTINISLSDNKIKVDRKTASTNPKDAVYIANDIVYYESGKDFTYGEGTEKDAHSKEDADAHTVVHITEAGTYSINGTLSKGQIAVDLGEDAEDNPDAVVTLVLEDAHITCEVAPAVIFYNVYECGNDNEETASKDVDTSKAGANVIIADGTTNTVNGSYVERIYEPGSVVLNDDKTAVEDADKLHKYDGAFYSKMSMNVNGQTEGTGILNINASNEGLDSELHLTINGGNINIKSGNDGINTNEDGISVATINNGTLNIQVTGETGEGDGLDSNGWLVINGGTVIASACANSADAGIDSDMGIHINGGTVIAGGHMLDRIEEGGQKYILFNSQQKEAGENTFFIKDDSQNTVAEVNLDNTFSILIYSSADLDDKSYGLYDSNDNLVSQSGMSMPGGMSGRPDEMGEKPGEMPGQPPEGFEPPEGFAIY